MTEPREEGTGVNEYMNAKAMLTPGLAGVTATMITGTLVSQFGIPGNWTGLIVCLFMGLIVWGDTKTPVVQRAFFYVVNSMTIYAVAIGINDAGVAISKSNTQAQYESRYVPPEGEESPFFRPWF